MESRDEAETPRLQNEQLSIRGPVTDAEGLGTGALNRRKRGADAARCQESIQKNE
jgi:hypothetical protein